MAVKRPYASNRRRRQAAQTRADILDAARRLFAERGYPATTVEAVAAEAEVSPATVYSAFGSKRGLLAAFQQLMHIETGYDERRRQLDAATDPPAQIAAGTQISLSFPHLHGDVVAAMLTARGVDAEIDEFLRIGLTEGHRGGWGIVAARLAAAGALRPGLSEKEAGDLGSALTRPEIYRLLAKDYGWSHERIEEVLTDTVCKALLGVAPPARQPADRQMSGSA